MDSFSLEFLKKILSNEYSDNYVDDILKGYNVNRRTTIRVNTLISTFEEVIQFLDKNNISYDMHIDNWEITEQGRLVIYKMLLLLMVHMI